MMIRGLGALVSVLPAVVTAWMLLVAARERSAPPNAWILPFRNSAEAAAAGDPARVLRMVRMGDNPNRVRPIEPSLISTQILQVTTLEAAMWSRQIDMIRALDREGAIVDAEQRRDLACLAMDLDLPDVATYLGVDRTCVPGAAVKRIIARTKSEGGGSDE